MAQMTVSGRQRTCVVVALDDRVASTPSDGDLTARIRQLFSEGVSTVVLDISRVQRLCSDDVSALLWARREARARGGRVVLHASNKRSAALVTRSELGRLFEVDVAALPPSPWRHP